ncbi:MAG: long-chain fatty acid--CoA ligase [Acidobacteria bacterium]|nr:long-chain fatty acid--CoA ligase [Acidobacteriota bacterium]MCW5970451.1 long-chain fatty acid--CoA ligase [Blastocatellales bacterium]
MSTSQSSIPESPYARKPWLRHYDFWAPAAANFPRQPIYQILQLATGRYGDRPASAFLGAQLTFREVKSQVDRLATALHGMGIAKGDRVGIMLPNSPQYMIAFFAISRLGAIVVNINPIYTLREVDLVAQDAALRAVITLDALAPLIIGVKPNSSIEHIITTSVQEYSAKPDSAPPVPEGTLSMTALINGVAEVGLPRVEIDAEQDVAVLQYTGGTTGVPKGAMLTHYNLYSNAIQTALWAQGVTEPGNERYLMVIPYFHIYGQTVGLLVGAWNGAMQIMIPKFDIEMLLHAIRHYQPTFFPSVPTLYISMLNHPESKNSGLDRVRRYNSGSAPLPVEVLEQFEALAGSMLYEGYGLTEASPVTHSTPTLAKRKPGSIGLPIPATECKIVDLETGQQEVPLGESGELCIRGPQVMKGYWNKPEETANTLRDGWLYTGDVARMDEDGFFYIVQRKKDMIIVSGFNVYPNEVEDVLFTHPDVVEAAVIGVPDAYRGEAVKAFVVLKPGAAASAEDVIAFCRDRMAKYKTPSAVEFLDALPKSAVGKVLRRTLREREEQKG